MIKLTILFIVVLLFVGCTVTKPITDMPESEVESFETVVSRLSTPLKIHLFLNTCSYLPDESYADEWLSPQEFYERGKGDCEDYALFALYCLEAHNIEGYIISVWTDDQGHAVCVFLDGDSTGYIEANNFHYVADTTYTNIAHLVYDNWKVYSIYPSKEGILRWVKNI